MVTVTIGGVSVSVLDDNNWSVTGRIDEQADCTFTVHDPTGAMNFDPGEQVEIVDDIKGTIYTGYVGQPDVELLYPNPNRLWNIPCVSQARLLSVQTSQKLYKQQYAGTIAVDMIQRWGADRGLFCKAALRWDELLSEWQQGTLSGTAATTNATNGNVGGGDLELALAGSPLTHTESSNGDWASGTLSSVVASGNSLTLNGRQGIKFSAENVGNQGNNAYVYYEIESGPYGPIANGDHLQYYVWIDGSSPAIQASVDGICASDGTTIRDFSYSSSPVKYIVDQNHLRSHPNTSLKGFADNQWYFRDIDLSPMAGKTLSVITLAFEGDSQGTYTAYFYGIQIVNGGTTQLTIYNGGALNASKRAQDIGYNNISISTPTVYDQIGYRVAPSVSLASVGILRSSFIAYDTTTPTGTAVEIDTSFEGGATWQPTTNMQAIANLEPGAALSGISLLVRQILSITGGDPTVAPSVQRIAWTLEPSYVATKHDLISTTNSSGGFNAGTYTNTKLQTAPNTRYPVFMQNGANQAITLNGGWQSWDDPGNASQSLYGLSGVGQAVNYRQLQLNTNGGGNDVRSRFDFSGQWANFIASMDIQIPATTNELVGFVYRTTNWVNANNCIAYSVEVWQDHIALYVGPNAGTSGSITLLGQVTGLSLSAGSWHKLKVSALGSSHIIWLDEVQYISVTDSTYLSAGYMAARASNGTANPAIYFFNSFGVASALSGTWQSPSLSLTSVGTVGVSLLQWQNPPLPDTCSIVAETSINGGTSWQSATNGGAISGLTPGTSTSGLSLLVRFTLTAGNASTSPAINAFTVVVTSAYSSSGTRIAPALSLAAVGRAATALVNWRANVLTGTTLAVATSINGGSSWQSVASPGASISGIAVQPAATIDTFDADSHTSYTQSNFSGVTGSWIWDTTHSRLSGSGGTNGTLVYNTALTGADSLVAADLDQADGSGLIANYQSASAMYFVQIWDASGTGTQNSVKLFKRSGGSNTQLGSTATIAFPRGRYRRFILDVRAGVLTVFMDGVQLIQATDGSPLVAGKSGLLLNALIRVYNMRLQQYGQDVSALSLLLKLTLGSTDPTLTPQVLDQEALVASTDITAGALIDSVDYRRTYLIDNFNDLNNKSKTTWYYVRNDKSVVFAERDAVPAPWILDSANATALGSRQQGDVLIKDLKVTKGGALYRNRQILTGVLEIATYNETRTGNGQTRTWNLSHALTAPPTSFTLNGNAVSLGIKGVDSGRDFYYQLNSTAIDQDAGGTLLKSIDVIAIGYSGSSVVEVVRDNVNPGDFPGTVSQADMAARTGETGVVEQVTDVSALNLDVPGAQAYGDQLLSKFGVMGDTLTFSTLRDGLAPGQQLPAFVPEQKITDGQFLITEAHLAPELASTVPGGVLYRTTITATDGANIGSYIKLLTQALK